MFLDPDQFALQKKLPEVLTHTRYCQICFDIHVAPARENYNEILERAKNVSVITTSYKGHVPVLKKSRVNVAFENCNDREDLIMKLAFQAAAEGFNALIQCDLVREKLRNYGYQKSTWKGGGTPATVDQQMLARNELREEVYRRGS